MRSGDRCEVCNIGRMRTRTTFTRGSSRVRYLVCRHCQATGKECLGLDDIGRPIFEVIATRSNTNRHQTTDQR